MKVNVRTSSGSPADRPEAGRPRDIRLDIARGLALLCILIDHIPGNYLARLTLQVWGFSHAAEVFVLIAGISSALAYAWRPNGMGRISRRIIAIYFAHIALLLTCAAIVLIGYGFTHNSALLTNPIAAPFREDFTAALLKAIRLDLQPEYLDILPLHILLLIWLAIFLRIAERSRTAALMLSISLWMVSQLGLNLSGHRDGGWYFNPLGWQLLFSIGILIGLGRLQCPPYSNDRLRRSLRIVAVGYLVFAFLYMKPWGQLGIPTLRELNVLPSGLVIPIDKTSLSLARLLHIVALAVVVDALVPAGARYLRESPILRILAAFGRKPLTSFCAASVASTVGTISLVLFGRALPYQIAANLIAVGFLALLLRLIAYVQAMPINTWSGFGIVGGRPVFHQRIDMNTYIVRAVAIVALTSLLLLTSAMAGVMERHTLHSRVLGAPSNYIVYKSSTARDERLPVLYLLHGADGDEMSWMRDGDLGRMIDRLVTDGKIKPLLVIMPSTGDCWWVDTPNCSIETMLWQELEPQIAARADAAAGRANRAIAGISAGGYGAVHQALSHPELVSVSVGMSPAVYVGQPPPYTLLRKQKAFKNPDGEFDAELWKARNYPALLPSYATGGQRVAFYLMAGRGDEYGLAAETAGLHEQLTAIQPGAVELHLLDGGHTWSLWRSALEDALIFIDRHLHPTEHSRGGQEQPSTSSRPSVAYGRW